jgi:hypothetical protein
MLETSAELKKIEENKEEISEMLGVKAVDIDNLVAETKV